MSNLVGIRPENFWRIVPPRIAAIINRISSRTDRLRASPKWSALKIHNDERPSPRNPDVAAAIEILF